jgi:hypothetical protein
MSTTTVAVKATRNTTSRKVNRTLVRLPSEDRTVIIRDVAVSVDDRPALDKAVAENNSHPWRTYDLEVVEVTVGEAPEPPLALPTEPGLYLERESGSTRDVWELKVDGTWRLVTGSHAECGPGVHDPELYLPFTRLVPEASA